MVPFKGHPGHPVLHGASLGASRHRTPGTGGGEAAPGPTKGGGDDAEGLDETRHAETVQAAVARLGVRIKNDSSISCTPCFIPWNHDEMISDIVSMTIL